MSSILTSIQIYSEGFFILQVRQKYMNAVLFIRQKVLISTYDKEKEVGTYESRYFETNNN